MENERDVLRRFQDRTPYLRSLLDEIGEPRDPPTIVLKYLEDPLLNASIKKTLNRKEVKYVSKRILEVLKVLHEVGYVHTGKDSTRHSSDDSTKSDVEDVKLDNVLVNYKESDVRFFDVKLGDLGGTYHMDSNYDKEGTPVGAPMWTSPEVIMENPWNNATDIGSFGTMVRLKKLLKNENK